MPLVEDVVVIDSDLLSLIVNCLIDGIEESRTSTRRQSLLSDWLGVAFTWISSASFFELYSVEPKQKKEDAPSTKKRGAVGSRLSALCHWAAGQAPCPWCGVVSYLSA